jgi:hypothetical protein
MEITLFIDHVGFTIVGEKVKSDNNFIEVKNPAVLQSAPNQQGQLQVQLMPVLFREFLDSSVRNDGVTFSYPKDRVIVSNAKLDERLKTQYEQMFSPMPTQQQGDNEVIKLFDEEENK